MIRVLIVDDDFMVARVHRAFVEQVEGFEVVGVAHSGADALALADELDPDLTLLDLYLPDAFGLDLVTELRRRGSRSDIIVISAAKEADAVRGAVRQGVTDYLLKPFSREDLRDRLEGYAAHRTLLESSSPEDQATVDRLFARAGGRRPGTGEGAMPKGLSPETARLVEAALREADGDLSATEAAEAVGVSRVSARRYLEYFTKTGTAEVSLRYGSTGRPERRYRLT
ncbi:response regulator of citrate/malate metabolism [Knoellia remsis]|uniref:Transcriptional regulatory protein n=1 Tax=Knoellia remsis TaxID=407159 RepID=A0A2T0UH20_9MICO|nr:response regulator [Knoellia remsis]PRY57117.1 response regulator of citrate/malate metabolism [Knoellia remsis]